MRSLLGEMWLVLSSHTQNVIWKLEGAVDSDPEGGSELHLPMDPGSTSPEMWCLRGEMSLELFFRKHDVISKPETIDDL